MSSNPYTLRTPSRHRVHPSKSVVCGRRANGGRRFLRDDPVENLDRHSPRINPNTSGATIDASDSITNFGVSIDSLPQVIFSFGTAPEYEP